MAFEASKQTFSTGEDILDRCFFCSDLRLGELSRTASRCARRAGSAAGTAALPKFPIMHVQSIANKFGY